MGKGKKRKRGGDDEGCGKLGDDDEEAVGEAVGDGDGLELKVEAGEGSA